MAIQRKIHHLLQSEGQDDTFHYLPHLRALFDLTKPILVTEKVDGSTMQAIRGEPWKRFDRFKKGDPQKRLVPEEDRYELRPCERNDPSLQWYLKSFGVCLAQFVRFGETHPNHWIYFEALGSKISARYKNLEPTIRVFDVSEESRFLFFEEAVTFAVDAGLPAVSYHWETFNNLENLLKSLAGATSRDCGFPPHQLEGWVLRQVQNQEEIVAKIRVHDLNNIK